MSITQVSAGFRRPLSRRGMLGALALIVLLGAACRAAALGARLHIDESFSWYVASAPSPDGFLRRLAATENTPPLFYLVSTLVAAARPAWLRLPAALPGLLLCPALFGAVRSRLGDPVAALSALTVAVAPFLITYSDLARGFMLADLALLVAVWALLSLSGGATPIRWAVFVVAGIVAIYTEYDSAIVLIAAVLVAAWQGLARRRHLLGALALVLVSAAPWIPEIVRAQHQLGRTKLSPMNAAPSVHDLREIVVTLVFGENGGTSSQTGHWILCLAVLAVLGAAGYRLRRVRHELAPAARATVILFGGTALLTLVGFALAALVGVEIFSQRYLTILVALVAPVFFAALVSLDRRALTAIAALGLTCLGIANTVRRSNGEYEPDVSPVAAAARAAHPRTVLTNTPTVLYYLRSLRPVLDRPYNLGPGRTRSCARPCLTVDDLRVPGGTPRAAVGAGQRIGPYVLTTEP